jgi:hypothetical protein
MSEENLNFDEAAKRDLERREYQSAETENESEKSVVSFDEKETKPTSLGKARDYQGDRDDEPALLPGYHEIWAENFPSKGLFYADGTRFFIRAASVKEIRHFSTINEQDPFSVDEALNEIIKGCLMMRVPGRQASFKDLREEDRIHVIMTIRDLTFVNGENKLAIKATCNECNHDNEIVINNQSFETNEIPETLSKYYDEERKMFVIQTKSCGTIEIVPPSIGVMGEVTKYIRRAQEQEGKKLDTSFVKNLPYMVTDWRGFNDQKIKNLEIEFMQWNSTKYQTFNALAEMCKIGVKEQLVKECEKCGSEVRAQITFPGGIKSLFVVSDIAGELL